MGALHFFVLDEVEQLVLGAARVNEQGSEP